MEWKAPLHTPARGLGRPGERGKPDSQVQSVPAVDPHPGHQQGPRPSSVLLQAATQPLGILECPQEPIPAPPPHTPPRGPSTPGEHLCLPGCPGQSLHPHSCLLAAPPPQPLTCSHTVGAENLPEDQLWPEASPARVVCQSQALSGLPQRGNIQPLLGSWGASPPGTVPHGPGAMTLAISYKGKLVGPVQAPVLAEHLLAILWLPGGRAFWETASAKPRRQE